MLDIYVTGNGCGSGGAGDANSKIKILQILRKFSGTKTAATSILELYVWVASRFYMLESDSNSERVIEDLVELGRKVMRNNRDMPVGVQELIVSIITALSVIVERSDCVPCCLKEFLSEALATKNIYIVDKSRELLRMLQLTKFITSVMSEKQGTFDSLDFTLSFLDNYVVKSLEQDGKPYIPLVGGLVQNLTGSPVKSPSHISHINLQPYGQLPESPCRASSHGSTGARTESISSAESLTWSLKR